MLIGPVVDVCVTRIHTYNAFGHKLDEESVRKTKIEKMLSARILNLPDISIARTDFFAPGLIRKRKINKKYWT